MLCRTALLRGIWAAAFSGRRSKENMIMRENLKTYERERECQHG